eukprot:744431-Pyramimonas_sp.AAC.1
MKEGENASMPTATGEWVSACARKATVASQSQGQGACDGSNLGAIRDNVHKIACPPKFHRCPPRSLRTVQGTQSGTHTARTRLTFL